MADETEVEPTEAPIVEPQNNVYTSAGGVIPTIADLTYIEKSATPPAE